MVVAPVNQQDFGIDPFEGACCSDARESCSNYQNALLLRSYCIQVCGSSVGKLFRTVLIDSPDFPTDPAAVVCCTIWRCVILEWCYSVHLDSDRRGSNMMLYATAVLDYICVPCRKPAWRSSLRSIQESASPLSHRDICSSYLKVHTS